MAAEPVGLLGAERVGDPTARVVDQDFDRPERGLRAVEQRRDGRRVGQVGLRGFRLTAFVTDSLEDGGCVTRSVLGVFRGGPRIRLIGQPEERDEHAAAVGGQRLRRRRTDAVVRAGDERDAAGESRKLRRADSGRRGHSAAPTAGVTSPTGEP